MNVSSDNTINARQNQNYIYPTDNFPPSTSNDNEIIVNNITPGKSSESIRDNPNPGKELLTAQQKLDNL